MFSDHINAVQVGVPGDACTTCGSALSPDQRYCLSCGTRRSGANLHFQQILAAEAAAQAPAVGTAQAAGGAGTGGTAPRSSMPALASIACLLLALGVGVLIGKSGSGSGSAGTTQAVTAAPLATDAAVGAADAEATAAKKKAKSTASDTPAASTAANPSLKKLESLSPEQYQKESLKLPKTVGTGGAPPPIDNKAPAGGGSFDTIG
jgi:hypothetical protein